MAWEPDDCDQHRIGGVGMLFRSLNDQQEWEYRQYARDNDPEDMSHWSVYHPVCRDEWEKRGVRP